MRTDRIERLGLGERVTPVPHGITFQWAQRVSGLIEPVQDVESELRTLLATEDSPELITILLKDRERAKDFILQQRYARRISGKSDGVAYVIQHCTEGVIRKEELPMKWYLVGLYESIRLAREFFTPGNPRNLYTFSDHEIITKVKFAEVALGLDQSNQNLIDVISCFEITETARGQLEKIIAIYNQLKATKLRASTIAAELIRLQDELNTVRTEISIQEGNFDTYAGIDLSKKGKWKSEITETARGQLEKIIAIYNQLKATKLRASTIAAELIRLQDELNTVRTEISIQEGNFDTDAGIDLSKKGKWKSE